MTLLEGEGNWRESTRALKILELRKDFQVKRRFKNGKTSKLMLILEGQRQAGLTMGTLTTSQGKNKGRGYLWLVKQVSQLTQKKEDNTGALQFASGASLWAGDFQGLITKSAASPQARTIEACGHSFDRAYN